VRREECAVAPVLAATYEKCLDRNGAALASEGEYVGVAQALRVHRLAALDVGQRSEAVAINCGELIILLVRGLSHGSREPGLHTCRLAGEELLRLTHHLAILIAADATHARCRTPLDLIEQTRPRPVGEKSVRTAS
jgi:hypothetical protein